MKTYKVTASYVTYCQVVIEAENDERAYQLAKGLDGGAFEKSVDGDDWHIERVVEVLQ
jgi:hypothetical protein